MYTVELARAPAFALAFALTLLAPSMAGAQHDHAHHNHHDHEHEHDHDPDSADPAGAAGPADPAWGQLDVQLALTAASYRTPLYEGSYQGLSATAGWTWRRLHLMASVPAYRIERNGKPAHGLGDAMLHGQVALLARRTSALGVTAMVMLPTGRAATGLGMGHTMLMSAAWASWSPHPLALSAALGYGHGLGGESVHAEHAPGQPWPLVEPMSFAEVTFDSSAMLALADGLGVGLRAAGAVPAGDGGHGRSRALGSVRASWREGRVETTAELQYGIAGDPFRLRGLVAASVRL
jgi:hypothetical protein